MKELQSTISGTSILLVAFASVAAIGTPASAQPTTSMTTALTESRNLSQSFQKPLANLHLGQLAMVPAPSSGNDQPNPKNIRTASERLYSERL